VVDKIGESPTYNFYVDERSDELRLNNLTPPSKPVGSPAFDLVLTGTGFDRNARVRWNGSPRVTVFTSSTSLTAQIPASDLVARGTATITVTQLTKTSNGLSFYVEGSTIPVNGPGLIRLSPSNARVGNQGFTLTILGKNFSEDSVVSWNGVNRETQFVSVSTLTIAVAASDLVTAGTATVKVSDKGYFSNELGFEIRPAVVNPRIYSLSPSTAAVGSADFYLTVRGAFFNLSSIITWDGERRRTLHISSTTMRTLLSASDLTRARVVKIQVIQSTEPAKVSNIMDFTIGTSTGPGGTPAGLTLTGLNPGAAAAGGPAFSLALSGVNFATSTVVLWNGTPRASTFVSSTTLAAAITAADIATPGVATVNVRTGGIVSNGQTFTILSSTPSIFTLAPSSATAGGTAFNLVVLGANFSPNSVVRWNDTDRTTVYVSSSEVHAAISDADIARAGSAQIRVTNPVSGTVSPAQAFVIFDGPDSARATDLRGLRVYPNPWSTDLGVSEIKFDGLTDNSTIKIFTLSARWVTTLQAPTGNVNWNLRNNDGDLVASGYYLYVITDNNGNRARGRLAIVR
jgi:hypothetical protein